MGVATVLALFSSPMLAEGNSSIMLGGGVGQYQFTQHVGAYDAATKLFPGMVAVFPSDDAIRDLGTIESVSPKKYEGREKKFFGEYEHRLGSAGVFGFTVGLSHTENQQLCQSNCGDIERSYYIANIAKTITALPPDMQLLAGLIYMARPDILDSKGMQSKHTLLDLGFNIHINPNGAVDPYLGAVGGVGVCSVDNAGVDACYAYKYGARFGFRFNLNNTLFLVTQAGMNRVEFNLTKKSGLGLETTLSSVKMKIPTPEKEALLAIGVNF